MQNGECLRCVRPICTEKTFFLILHFLPQSQQQPARKNPSNSSSSSNQVITVRHFSPCHTLVIRLISLFENMCSSSQFEVLSRICQCTPLSTISEYKELVNKLSQVKNILFVGQLFYPIKFILRFISSPPLSDFFGVSSVLKIYLPAYFGNIIAQRQLESLCEKYEFKLEKKNIFLKGVEYPFTSKFFPRNAMSNLYCNGKHLGNLYLCI